MSGYIKIHRSIQKKGWYRKPGYTFLWLHILMKANYSDSEFWFNGQLIKLKPGQFVTGRNQLALETALSGSFIERALKVFESEQQIEQQTNNRNRLITILNYDLYQQNEQPKKKIRTASGQQADTNKELKENKEEYKETSFETFWNKYPNKTGKKPAREKFDRLTESEKETILKTIDAFAAYKPFETYSYPHATTYLNQRRWEDVIPSPEKKEHNITQDVWHIAKQIPAQKSKLCAQFNLTPEQFDNLYK